jgi:hypothetical protein
VFIFQQQLKIGKAGLMTTNPIVITGLSHLFYFDLTSSPSGSPASKALLCLYCDFFFLRRSRVKRYTRRFHHGRKFRNLILAIKSFFPSIPSQCPAFLPRLPVKLLSLDCNSTRTTFLKSKNELKNIPALISATSASCMLLVRLQDRR